MSSVPKPSGKIARKQHWVPQFYLRHFADSSGRFHAYSKRKGDFFCAGSKDLCSKQHLYEVVHSDTASDAAGKHYAPNLIEIKLSERESHIAPPYDHFLGCCKESFPEGKEYLEGKAAICELAANLIARHPISMRNNGKPSREDAEELLENIQLTPYELDLLDWSGWRGDSQAVVELAATATMLFFDIDTVPVNLIREFFLAKPLSILKAHVVSGFVKTSMPMFIIGPEDDSYDFELAYMPLSSESAAVFSDAEAPGSFMQLSLPGTELMSRLLLLNSRHWDAAMSKGKSPLDHAIRNWSKTAVAKPIEGD